MTKKDVPPVNPRKDEGRPPKEAVRAAKPARSARTQDDETDEQTVREEDRPRVTDNGEKQRWR